VVAAGGDGTVAEVMAAAYGLAVPVAIVPLGTANIVARELHLPRRWPAALQLALTHHLHGRSVDLARVNDRYSVLAAGMGFDVAVMRHTPRRLKDRLGRLAYLLTGVLWLPRSSLFRCTIRSEGCESTVVAIAAMVVNAGMLGASPFRFGPAITIDDGWLDLCLYQPRSLAARLGIVWSIATRRQERRSDIRYRRVRAVELKSPDVGWYQVDGEVHQGNALRIEILPGGITVVAGPPLVARRE